MNERLNSQGSYSPSVKQNTKYPTKPINSTVPVVDRLINVQDAFLNYVRRNKIQVTIFLMNGVKVIGFISCFDQNTILVKRENYTQLIYKHAVSTVYPHSAINLFEWNIANKRELDIDDDLGSLVCCVPKFLSI